jgi:hypothetical protein
MFDYSLLSLHVQLLPQMHFLQVQLGLLHCCLSRVVWIFTGMVFRLGTLKFPDNNMTVPSVVSLVSEGLIISDDPLVP